VITAVPADKPVTVPLLELTEAMLLVLLVHETPGVVVLLNTVVVPAHNPMVPVIAAGVGLTVNIAVAAQPVPSVYEMRTVPPETPVTTPVDVTVAMPVLALLHVPSGVVLVRVVEAP
jgi:hypothetical protein